MRTVYKYIDPGKARKGVNFIDHIVYSKVTDLEGNDLELDLSIMSQSGNSEMRAAAARFEDPEEDVKAKPAIVWVSGGGFRGVDKNQMLAETHFLAEAGYVIASVYYRSSAEGHFPDQIIDVKAAIRFLRAHAEDFQIDPNRIGIMGRSAGGYLAAMMALNLDGYDSDEWAGYSSHVQAAYDMFGPTDLVKLMEFDKEQIDNNPDYRWKREIDTHAGAFIGGGC